MNFIQSTIFDIITFLWMLVLSFMKGTGLIAAIWLMKKVMIVPLVLVLLALRKYDVNAIA